jgi:hypothetical protein
MLENRYTLRGDTLTHDVTWWSPHLGASRRRGQRRGRAEIRTFGWRAPAGGDDACAEPERRSDRARYAGSPTIAHARHVDLTGRRPAPRY